MNHIELLTFARFLACCLIVRDREWVERMAVERRGTPEGDLLLEELEYMALEDEVGFVAAIEADDERLAA